MKVENLAKDLLKTVVEVQQSVDKNKTKLPANAHTAKGYLVLHSVKGAALVGFERGYGMAFKVLEAQLNGAPRLSAPVIVKLSKVAVGLQLGYNSVFTVVVLPTEEQFEALATSSETIMGKDFDISGLQQGEQTNTVSFHRTSIHSIEDGVHLRPTVLSVADSLMVADISLYGGTLGVEKELMSAVYGDPYGSPKDVLEGKVLVPEHLQAVVEPIAKALARLVAPKV